MKIREGRPMFYEKLIKEYALKLLNSGYIYKEVEKLKRMSSY
jgi:hypothetical protein